MRDRDTHRNKMRETGREIWMRHREREKWETEIRRDREMEINRESERKRWWRDRKKTDTEKKR